jgi:hypothetical protein
MPSSPALVGKRQLSNEWIPSPNGGGLSDQASWLVTDRWLADGEIRDHQSHNQIMMLPGVALNRVIPFASGIASHVISSGEQCGAIRHIRYADLKSPYSYPLLGLNILW